MSFFCATQILPVDNSHNVFETPRKIRLPELILRCSYVKPIALGCRMHLSMLHTIREGTVLNHKEAGRLLPSLYVPVKSNTNVLRPPTVYF